MIYIVRHGQTAKNKANLLQGRSDVPLNDTGVEQAKAVRERFEAAGIRFDKVYTSPLIRAVQTAEIISEGSGRALPGIATGSIAESTCGKAGTQGSTGAQGSTGSDGFFVMEPRLIEMDYGPYEGMDLTQPAPEVLTFFQDFVHNPAPDGMEPLADVVARLGEFLDEIREEAVEKNILISTHAIAMKGALEYLTPESKGSYWAFHIGNCAVYVAEARKEGGFSVPIPY